MTKPSTFTEHDGVTKIVAAVHALDVANTEIARLERELAEAQVARAQA